MIFQKRSKGENQHRKSTGSHKIAVFGAARSAGVTHVCLLLAQYAAMHLGKATALLECNSHGDFQRMEEEARGSGTLPFTYGEADLYESHGVDDLRRIEQDGYRYIILDCGSSFLGKEEYLRACDCRILLGGDSPWIRHGMQLKQSVLNQQQWLFLHNLSVQGIAYCPLEKVPPRETVILFDQILGGKEV